MTLKIEYGTLYELMEIFKNHPEDVAEIDRLAAEANKKVDDLTMKLEILTAELVDEISKKRKVPASAKQEVRRAEIQMDNRWKLLRSRLNEAIEESLILQGRSKGMFIRGRMLELLGKIELRNFGDPTVYIDNRNPDTKVNSLEDKVDLNFR